VGAAAESPRRAEAMFVSDSPQATERIGARIAAILVEGDVVGLIGELGAGKTSLARGILRGLGVVDVVQSPTFVVERRYSGRVTAQHLDLYRIEGMKALSELGIPDRFSEPGVFLVEWAERAEGLLPQNRIEIVMEDLGGTKRRILVAGPGAKIASLSDGGAADA
jgi:tRNA threonylcarbamoyl adenosine modification protein YjeE